MNNDDRKCKNCEYFYIGGINTGYCEILQDDVVANNDGCKRYSKIESEAEDDGR